MTVSLCRTRNVRDAAKLAGVRARWTGDQTRRLRVSRSGRIATDQKAVQTRGPGRVVLGSKPQLATTEKLVRWATKLVSWAVRARSWETTRRGGGGCSRRRGGL